VNALTEPEFLVIRGGAVGDFVLTLPAIRLLREGFPHARISVLGYPSIARLGVLSGVASAVHSLEQGALARFFAPGAELDPELVRFFGGFQLVISWLYDPDGYFHANLERCGPGRILVADPHIREETGIPAAAQLAKPLEELALFLEDSYLQIPRERLNPVASGHGPRIGIHPGSGSPKKNWGYETWARAASQLQREFPDIRFEMITGEAEEETIESLFRLFEEAGVRSLTHRREPLCDLASTLASCQLFFGHDSGISHLAAATGIPCVLLFGPTDPGVWAPRNPRVTVLRKPSGSLAGIQPEEVVEAARKWLGPNPDRNESTSG